MAKNKNKCKCCGKEMTDAEYIKYLEAELAKVKQELVFAKSSQTTIPYSKPYTWIWPNTCGQDGTINIPSATGHVYTCGDNAVMTKYETCTVCGGNWFETPKDDA